MSTNANFTVDVDLSPAVMKLSKLSGDTQKADQRIDQTVSKLHQVWGYAMHITNLIITNLSRTASTQEEQASIQAWQSGLQIAQTQISILYTFYRAAVFGIEGKYFQMSALLAVGTLMQTSLIQQQVNKMEAARIQKQVNYFKTSMEMNG